MDTVIGIIMSYQFSFIHLIIAGVVLFFIGYLRGKNRLKEMARTIYELEKSLLHLNEELLFGKKETPIIEIQHAQKNMHASK
jgi:hypothetical protein